MQLTNNTVLQIEIPAGKSELIAFDDTLPGFGVRIREGGRRTWIAQYRVGRQQRRVTLGKVGTVGLAAARDKAKKMLAQVQLGDDPQADRKAELARTVVTVGAIGEKYLAVLKRDVDRGHMKPRSYAEVERHIQKHWKPLASRPAHKVTRADIAERLGEIDDASGPVAANRARSSASAMFAWAMREGLVENNPVIGTNKRDETSRDRVLTAAELVAVWKACGDDEHGKIVRLLILTAQRREEVGGMAESELQRDLRMWSLPKGRTKNSLPHIAPLSAAARALLPKPRADRDMLFGRGDGSYSGWSRSKERLDARIVELSADGKGIAPWTLHDLRRTARTGMSALGVLPHIAERVLNHVSGRDSIQDVYDQWEYLDEKRDALDKWAAHVAGLVKGKPRNVVPLARR